RAHLLETQGNILALTLASVGDDGEMRRTQLDPLLRPGMRPERHQANHQPQITANASHATHTLERYATATSPRLVVHRKLEAWRTPACRSLNHLCISCLYEICEAMLAAGNAYPV